MLLVNNYEIVEIYSCNNISASGEFLISRTSPTLISIYKLIGQLGFYSIEKLITLKTLESNFSFVRGDLWLYLLLIKSKGYTLFIYTHSGGLVFKRNIEKIPGQGLEIYEIRLVGIEVYLEINKKVNRDKNREYSTLSTKKTTKYNKILRRVLFPYTRKLGLSLVGSLEYSLTQEIVDYSGKVEAFSTLVNKSDPEPSFARRYKYITKGLLYDAFLCKMYIHNIPKQVDQYYDIKILV